MDVGKSKSQAADRFEKYDERNRVNDALNDLDAIEWNYKLQIKTYRLVIWFIYMSVIRQSQFAGSAG